MEMSNAKPNKKTRSKSKSKRSSPRLYSIEDLPQFMQPLLQTRHKPATTGQQQRQRRPKSEILQELRRLRLQRDDDDNADDDEDEMKKKIVSPVASVPILPVNTLKELDALRLTRHRLEQLLNCSSSFDQTVLNCFVRVNIKGANVLPEYRIGEIMGVLELPMGYIVGKTATNKALELRYEDLVEQHELNDVSNMAFTSEEFDFWHDNCICQSFELPTTELIARKKIEWYNAFNSGTHITSALRQKGSIGFSMRAVPKGGLLERLGGGVYPWKLQRPTLDKPSANSTGSTGNSSSSNEMLESKKISTSEQLLESNENNN